VKGHTQTGRLVAYDGSPSARRALEHAAGLHRIGDRMSVIFVGPRGQERDAGVDDACRALADRGIHATPIHSVGDPARTICVTAERDRFDTIVVGRRNLGASGQLLLGSVSGRVVAGASCDVVVVA
jgi:nucleotide-binding universal stress UspA family protein